jgi:hypothetical protein
MKLHNLVSVNGGFYVALGIGFTIYAPNFLAYFGVSDLAGDNYLLYWNIVAFARMFGVLLLAFGLILWSLRKIFSDPLVNQGIQREILFSLVLGHILIIITVLTQQSSVWGSIVGWIIALIFLIFLVFYIYFWIRGDNHA